MFLYVTEMLLDLNRLFQNVIGFLINCKFPYVNSTFYSSKSAQKIYVAIVTQNFVLLVEFVD